MIGVMGEGNAIVPANLKYLLSSAKVASTREWGVPIGYRRCPPRGGLPEEPPLPPVPEIPTIYEGHVYTSQLLWSYEPPYSI